MAEISTALAPAKALAPASAPAPAAPKPSAGSNRPQPQRSSTPAKDMNDAFSQLDKMGLEPDPEPQPKKQDAAPLQKPDTKPPGEQKQDGQQPPDDQKPAETGFPDPDKARQMRAGELSRHYKALKVEFDKQQAKIAELSNRPVDTEKLTKLEAEAKENHARWEKAQEELRFTRYEKSHEYQEKYWKPYEKAYQDGVKKVTGLTVVPRVNEDTGETIQPARAATQADFDSLFGTIDDNKAAEMAEQLFGSKAPLVMIAREKALEANQNRITALEEYRAKGAEYEKGQADRSKAEATELNNIFVTESKTAAEKYPTWFKPVEGDEKGNEILQKASDLAIQAFSGYKTDENGQRVALTAKERAKLNAAMFNKAAAFDRLVYRNQNLLKKVASLEEKLKSFDGSEPGEDGGRRGKKEATGSTMDQTLAKIGV